MSQANRQPAVLVIKHGALGDLILATSAFAAIRQQHQGQRVVLITHPSYLALAQRMPFFDEVWTDRRPKFWQWRGWLKVWNMLRGRHDQRLLHFTRVYDLQGSQRTAIYHALRPHWQAWLGATKHCAMPRPFSAGELHVSDSYVRHFAKYGMTVSPFPDVTWLRADVNQRALPERFVLLVPSCSAKHHQKRWPASAYAAVVNWLFIQGVATVVVGAGHDRIIFEQIKQQVNNAAALHDLVDASPLFELPALAQRSLGVLGVDTGPMHLLAATHVPTVVLFSGFRSPTLCAPRGRAVRVLEAEKLSDLPSETVCAALVEHCSGIAGQVASATDRC